MSNVQEQRNIIRKLQAERDELRTSLDAALSALEVALAQRDEMRAGRDAAVREMRNLQAQVDEQKTELSRSRMTSARLLDDLKEARAERDTLQEQLEQSQEDAVWKVAGDWQALKAERDALRALLSTGGPSECPTCGRETRSQTTPDGRHRYFTCADPWHEQPCCGNRDCGHRERDAAILPADAPAPEWWTRGQETWDQLGKPGHACGEWCIAVDGEGVAISPPEGGALDEPMYREAMDDDE